MGGVRVGRLRPELESSGQRWRPLGWGWLAIAIWTGGTYLAALAVLVTGLLIGGILDLPTVGDLSPVVVVVALCAAWTALGLAIGYRWSSPLVAPVVAVAAFAFTLLAHTTQPYLVKVGGATASLLFLRPRPFIQVAQLVFFGGIVISALRGVRTDVRACASRPSVIVGPVLAAAGFIVLTTVPGLEFLSRPQPMVCDGEEPEICVAQPYRDRISWPRPYLVPYLAALRDLDIGPPSRFTQSDRRAPGVDVPPASWALLLHPVGSVSASVAAVLAVGPALIVYLRADPPRRWP